MSRKMISVSAELHEKIKARAHLAECTLGVWLERALAEQLASEPPAVLHLAPPLMEGADLAERLGVTDRAIRAGWRARERWTVRMPGVRGRPPSLYPTRPGGVSLADVRRSASPILERYGIHPSDAEVISPEGEAHSADDPEAPSAPALFI